jgi:hypothetical protein
LVQVSNAQIGSEWSKTKTETYENVISINNAPDNLNIKTGLIIPVDTFATTETIFA